MSNESLRGAAFHEAGHAIVAREFGLPIGEIAVGIDGDEAKGRTDIGPAHHLPIIDRIALCVAGIIAQGLFDCPIQHFTGAADYAKVKALVEDKSEADSLKLRHAGYVRAREILESHAADVEQLVDRLLRHRCILFAK